MASDKMQRLVKLIVLPTVSTLATLMLLEFLLIVLEPYLFKGFYQYDPDLGFRVRSYANETNQFGFNDRDYPLQKDPDIFRILVLGDSFSWAGGLEGNYTALLEKKFDKYYGRHQVDVINAGYPMTHTAEQLALLKKYGLQYNPDLVFLGFFAGNDFLDAEPNRKRIVVNDVYLIIDKRYEFTFLGYPLVPRSRVIEFLKQKYIVAKELMKWRRDMRTKGGEEEGGGTFSEERFLRIERARLEFCNVNEQAADSFNERIEYILQSIGRMKDLLQSKNIGFAVGIYPDEFQVNGHLLDQLFDRFDLKREEYDVELMQRILRHHLVSEEIPHVDLLREFRSSGREGELYLPRNTHWNAAGNDLAANTIFDLLVKIVDEKRAAESSHGLGRHSGARACCMSPAKEGVPPALTPAHAQCSPRQT
ncbi:MAG: hypothetical protein ACE5M4_13845 [Anaerolineales bacterium]